MLAHLINLNYAQQQDRAARREAIQRGMVATKPFSAIRLKEMCDLGEKMMAASKALAEAEDSMFSHFGVRWPPEMSV